ncbi:MAG: YhdH/YhfP family quinone oxidoreductase [Oleiphilaceae bacterium]|nr:YhdH/YhfP family quinone oxidoreductase [Oleiphilaceae bacterium]
MTSFRSWRVHEEDGQFSGRIEEQNLSDLPEGEVLIRVSHSSLNFKDALSASGNKGVTRKFPHTPGIDAAGEVVSSSHSDWQSGEQVIVTGYDLGMNTPGGFGEYIRVPAQWCVKMPDQWDGYTAMVYGTAGLTAGLCVDKLVRNGLVPGQGTVLVTGASGGVGSIAVELLSNLGFEVVAMSGKQEQNDWLRELGAAEVVGRDALTPSRKPMEKPLYSAAVDTVGGEPLATLLKQIQPEGAVAACGLAAGTDLVTSVFPFIIRGVTLAGVDSVEIPIERKSAIWSKLSTQWRCHKSEATATRTTLEELKPALDAFLQGRSTGRVVLVHQGAE